MTKNIVIIGSGIIGLSIAYLLLLESKEEVKSITLISQHFPDDKPIDHEYTSPWAGAHFRPFPHSNDNYLNDKRESNYTRISYDFFKNYLVKKHPESTVEITRGFQFFENPPKSFTECADGINGKSLEGFKILKNNDLLFKSKFGCQYFNFSLNAPKYLIFLQNQIFELSKKQSIPLFIKRMKLKSLHEVTKLFNNTDYIFNASGLGLQWDGTYDQNTYTVRGQTLLVEAPPHTKFENETHVYYGQNDHLTFVIKRPSGNNYDKPLYILGGTKEKDCFDIMPSKLATERILDDARIIFPELLINGEFKILNINVGFRPFRKGGSRVESETISNVKIIHAYGFGSMGFEVSIGAARHAIQLMSSEFSPKL
ncbi:hypothetical protein C6P40_002497 [Pichia californica]|uniref:FAD dependent oxidoreductase domain-containing protein n=1 Tax=Pichia californica TaxID=460514 RepID=A0A9P6WI02_9ASCO|nr:hypothetical protein C6P42_002475 [[Candida] californica]KAG0687327.1 hypothetical protein C6P40_002497 [[Candida] californica]